jgi:magnesium-transporting ATPase (P-type)
MNTENIEQNIISLENERQRYITKLFWFMLEIALIFLIPAFTAVFISIEFFTKKAVWYALPFTFVLSWVIVIIRWKKINKIMTKLDSDIRDLKKQKQHERNN